MKKNIITLLIACTTLFSCSSLDNLLDENTNKPNETQNQGNNNSNTDNTNNQDSSTKDDSLDTPSGDKDNPSDNEPSNPDSPTEPDTPPTEPDEPSTPATPQEPDIPTTDDEVEVTGIKLVNEEINIYLNHTHKLVYELLPVNTTQEKVFFTSDIPHIASVDTSGVISALKIGSTLIRAITDNGYFAYCKVNVIDNPNFRFNKPCVDLYIGENIVNATGISNTTYSSENSSIASVDSSGKIVANSVGVTYIKAVNGNDISYCDVRVLERNHSNFVFNDIDSTTCEITGYASTVSFNGILSVPYADLNNKKVVKIANSSLSSYKLETASGNKKVNNIILPNSIMELGDSAFGSLIGYYNTTFYCPYYLKKIGGFAFANDYFSQIKLNNNLEEIGTRAFINWHNHQILDIPSKVVLKLNCFHDNYGSVGKNGLTKVYIQEGAKADGNNIFEAARELDYINIPTSFTKIPSLMLQYASGLDHIVVPSTCNEIAQLNFSSDSTFKILLESDVLKENYSDSNTVNQYYLYSAKAPTSSGNYWHYVSGVPTIW